MSWRPGWAALVRHTHTTARHALSCDLRSSDQRNGHVSPTSSVRFIVSIYIGFPEKL